MRISCISCLLIYATVKEESCAFFFVLQRIVLGHRPEERGEMRGDGQRLVEANGIYAPFAGDECGEKHGEKTPGKDKRIPDD